MEVSSIGQPFAQSDPFEKLFCELYTSQKQSLYEFVLSRVSCSSVAEDIVQEVFLKLWSSKERCAPMVENYQAFLFRMAHNEIISYIRKENIKHQVFKNLNTQKMDALNLTEEMIYQKELEVLLQLAIEKLSPQCKRVYLLGKIEGLPLEEVAVIFNVSYQTIKNQIRQANQEIRNYVNEKMNTERKRKMSKGKIRKHGFEQIETLKAA